MTKANTHTPKRALITGASRGLGRGLAHALAKRGVELALVARETKALESLAAELQGRYRVRAHALPADLAVPRESLALAARVSEALGKVDLLIHNASALGPLPMPSLLDTDREALLDVLQVNLLAPHALTRALLGQMVLHGHAQIVAISSDAAVEAYAGWGAYSLSKAALDHMTRIWAQELADQDIRFLSLSPVDMNTQMHADAIPGADPSELADPNRVAEAMVRILFDDETTSGSRLQVGEASAQSDELRVQS